MRKIVVLGCGFGGYHAAQILENELEGRRRTELTVVTDKAHFVFTPLLSKVASGQLDITHISMPILDQFKKRTKCILDHIHSIDCANRRLIGQRHTIDFDYLILAPGGVIDWADHPQWQNNALTCRSARDAMVIKDAIQSALSEAIAQECDQTICQKLRIVVVGAGSSGVELAADLCASIRAQWTQRAPEQWHDALQFYLIDKESTILPRYPEEMQKAAHQTLEAIGAKILLGEEVIEISEQGVKLSSGEFLTSSTVIWCGGTRAPGFLKEAGFAVDSRGRALVDQCLHALDQRGIYVIGDAASAQQLSPSLAQLAYQQAQVASKNLLANLAGRSTQQFVYEDKGTWIGLGPGHAAVSLGDRIFDGRSAQLMYRLYHTAWMPRNLKKLRLLKDWNANAPRLSDSQEPAAKQLTK